MQCTEPEFERSATEQLAKESGPASGVVWGDEVALCHEGAREILPYIMDVLASHRSLRAMVPHLGG